MRLHRGLTSRLWTLSIYALVAMLTGLDAFADTIALRTGERLVGKIISEEPGKVVIESQALGRIEVPRERIKRIERDTTPAQPFTPPPPPAVKPTATVPATNAPALSTNAPPKRRWFWTPKPSQDEESSDWIQLKSGEWLRGRLYGMQNRKVEFESDEMDDLTFDWKDVYQVQTPKAVVSHGERQSVAGALRVDRQTVTVIGETGLVSFAREDLIGIASGQPRERDYWSGKFNVGLNLRSGNTEQADFVTKANLERRTPNTHLKLDYTGNFSKVDGEETVNNQRVNGNFNIFLTRRLFLVTPLAEYYRDPFQNIQHRYTLGAGAGYYLIDRPKVEWLVAGGPAFQRTVFDAVEMGEAAADSTPSMFIQSHFEVALSKRVDLEMDYQVTVTSPESGRATHHASTTLEIDLTRRLDLDISFILDRIENPQAGSDGVKPKKNDFRLNLSLGVKF